MADMEKCHLFSESVGLSESNKPVNHTKRRISLHGWIQTVFSCVVLCLLVLQYTQSLLLQKHDQSGNASKTKVENHKDFDEISPSRKLRWSKCFDSFLCSRLQVPMDYHRPLNASLNHPTVEIALIMLPGKNHVETGKFSVSPLILNPGGPGGSGVALVSSYGHAIQHVVSSDLDQDVLSFDPRGIGATTPWADCYSFPAEQGGKINDVDRHKGWFKRLTWLTAGETVGIVNSTESSLTELDARARANALLCEMAADLDGNDSILRHISTPAVATDMISIIDAWDHWRQESGQITVQETEMEEAKGALSTQGKLVYWGFSYGTLLGATFSSMFPGRVGRVMLDGVVDADVYVSPSWSKSLIDTDAAEASFWKFCHKAGESCVLYRDGDSEHDVQVRYQSILQSWKQAPPFGVHEYLHTPSIVTYDFVRPVLFAALYSPVNIFPAVATILDLFSKGDYSTIINALATATEVATYEPFCSSKLPKAYLGGDAQAAIMCSDKRYPLNETVPELQKQFEKLAKTSRWADIWTTIMLGCDGWRVKAIDPPMDWDSHPAHKQTPIKTSFPLLFLSNTADPVTPLFAGVKMARKFVDAGLVEAEFEGHCTLAQASSCIVKKIRQYIHEGKVPAPPSRFEVGKWEKCERDEQPWKPFVADAWIMEQMHLRAMNGNFAALEDVTEEARVLESWKVISKSLVDIVGSLGPYTADRAVKDTVRNLSL